MGLTAQYAQTGGHRRFASFCFARKSPQKHVRRRIDIDDHPIAFVRSNDDRALKAPRPVSRLDHATPQASARQHENKISAIIEGPRVGRFAQPGSGSAPNSAALPTPPWAGRSRWLGWQPTGAYPLLDSPAGSDRSAHDPVVPWPPGNTCSAITAKKAGP